MLNRLGTGLTQTGNQNSERLFSLARQQVATGGLPPCSPSSWPAIGEAPTSFQEHGALSIIELSLAQSPTFSRFSSRQISTEKKGESNRSSAPFSTTIALEPGRYMIEQRCNLWLYTRRNRITRRDHIPTSLHPFVAPHTWAARARPCAHTILHSAFKQVASCCPLISCSYLHINKTQRLARLARSASQDDGRQWRPC